MKAARTVEASIKEDGKTLAEDVVFAATGEVARPPGDTSKGLAGQAARPRQGRGRRGRGPTPRRRSPQPRRSSRPPSPTWPSGIEDATASEREHVTRETDDARLWATPSATG